MIKLDQVTIKICDGAEGRICEGLTHGEYIGLFIGLPGLLRFFKESLSVGGVSALSHIFRVF